MFGLIYLIFTPINYAPAVLYFWFLEHTVFFHVSVHLQYYFIVWNLLPVFFPQKALFKGICKVFPQSLGSHFTLLYFPLHLICTSTIMTILYCTCCISFHKYLLTAYNMPDTFLNIGAITINKNKSLPTWNYCTIWTGETNINSYISM